MGKRNLKTFKTKTKNKSGNAKQNLIFKCDNIIKIQAAGNLRHKNKDSRTYTLKRNANWAEAEAANVITWKISNVQKKEKTKNLKPEIRLLNFIIPGTV